MAAAGNGTATGIREATEEQTGAAATWVAMFAEGWADPVDADTFCDHFDPWFDPEVRMIQPSVRPTVGRKGFREEFARPLFTLVPTSTAPSRTGPRRETSSTSSCVSRARSAGGT